MRLGYVIAYVADVDATIEWWERAFGLGRRFVAEDGSYGELDTGATTLSFASHEMGKANLPGGFAAHDPSGPPAALEIALVDDDVPAAHARARRGRSARAGRPQAEALGPDRLVRARPQRRAGRALLPDGMSAARKARPSRCAASPRCSPRRSRSAATASPCGSTTARSSRCASAGSSRRAGGPTRRCAGPTPSWCWPTAASPSCSRILRRRLAPAHLAVEPCSRPPRRASGAPRRKGVSDRGTAERGQRSNTRNEPISRAAVTTGGSSQRSATPA